MSATQPAASFSERTAGAVIQRVPRVLFVESYPEGMFGQQRILMELLRRCPKEAVEPVVAVPAHGTFAETAAGLGIPVKEIPYPPLLASYGGAIYGYRGLRQARTGIQLCGYVLGIRRALRRWRVSAVFCNDMRGLLTVGAAARSLGIPVMIWDKLDSPHGWMDRLQLPLANRCLFISEAVKTKFSPRQLKKYAPRLRTVPDGADLPQFDSVEADRKAFGLATDEIAIGIVGSITGRKGHDRLLRIVPNLVREVPQARILVAGAAVNSGAANDYIAHLPNREHPCVRWLGMREDIPRLMHSLDILAVPSRREGLGLVILEAMACAKPVVGARTGGIPEVVVHGETGLLIDGEDPRALFEALVRLCRSAELRQQMGCAGRERVATHFNHAVQMEKVLGVLLEMTEREGRQWK